MATSRPWILLCPASRGIGLALGRHLLRNTTVPILATCRGDPESTRHRLLDGLVSAGDDPSGRLEVVRLDVTREETMADAAAAAAALFPPPPASSSSSTASGAGGGGGHHLHLAFALPGILLNPEKSPAQVDYGSALDTFRVNALGPLLLMKWFEGFMPRKATRLDLGSNGGSGGGDIGGYGGSSGGDALTIPPQSVWVNMSARVGSTADNQLGGWYSYRSSKAAVNSLTKSLDVQLRARAGDKAMAISYHPGTVKTELSRDFWGSVSNDALFEPDDAAERMARVVTQIRPEQRGKCWDYKGEEVPP
ncbi:hypothetical protein B0T26DRAFT_634373 [Lasiosphaeria miniovina]|uniref:Uncharacterized protein n=1 Tax=Lasiosphaeria miniovina TaxID=1954250 RepID=A0AA40EBA4_9PEZI|nr:uncharacterized protein B0T26DRAFT_634373 [Lasiosphaeria miniovina]KAK0733655.1 hypothetical protein B0T26DRAFT_634373 [Lasiosphaeria miniovina]